MTSQWRHESSPCLILTLSHDRHYSHDCPSIVTSSSFQPWCWQCATSLMALSPLANLFLTHATVFACSKWIMLISDVVCLSGTYLILSIRIRLYLCRLDYIFYCTYRLGYPYCPSSLGRLIVLPLLFSLGTFLLFPNGLLSCITIDGLDLVSRTFCRVQ